MVHICHDTSIDPSHCHKPRPAALMGSLYFFRGISSNQPLFLIAQSGDAISADGDSDVQWQPMTPLVKRSALESHTHPLPLWRNSASPPRVHLCSSYLKSGELIVWQGSGWAAPTTARVVPRREAASPACQTRCRKNPTEKNEARRGGALILLQVAVFVFVSCSWLLSSQFSAELKKHAEILQAAGWDDKRAATWPVWSR